MTVRKLHGQTSAEMREMFSRWYLQPLAEAALALGPAGPAEKITADTGNGLPGKTGQPVIAIEAVYLAVAAWSEQDANSGTHESETKPRVRLRLIPSPDLSWSWKLVSHPSNPLFDTPPEGSASWDDYFARLLESRRFSPHDRLDAESLRLAFGSFCKESRSSRNSLTDAFAPVFRVIRGPAASWSRDSNWAAKVEQVGVMLHPELEDTWDEPVPEDPLRRVPISLLLDAVGLSLFQLNAERTRLNEILTAAEAWLEHPDAATEQALETLIKGALSRE